MKRHAPEEPEEPEPPLFGQTTWTDHCGWCGIALTGWNKDHDVGYCQQQAATFHGIRVPMQRLDP